MNCNKKAVLALIILLSFTANAAADPTVGVYYYPWWGAGEGGHTLNQSVRAHLNPDDHLPAAGDEYSSRDPNVIAAHIDQSHLGNISMWSMSWWGPNSYEDITIRNNILTHPRASELSYTVHYESTGRLGTFASPNYSNLIPDFQHLANNVFNDPSYMRIDGRPVVVMYLTREYFDDAAGANALSDLRLFMQLEHGYDPYIIGDHVFNSLDPGASNLDAVTGFDIYGQVFNDGVVNQSRIDQLANIYSAAQSSANTLGVDFVPGLAPGYNDKAVRPGNDPAARYLPGEGFGSVMQAMLDDAVLPHTDTDINELILVNSFNEWHEDTQIEASVAGQTTNMDNTPSGTGLTVGRDYEGYENRYLDILRNATLTALTPAEIRWGRGTAAGMFVGNFTDSANWNGDDAQPDAPRVPTDVDRARVDRGGTDMTIDSTLHVNEFLFGVDEAGQTFTFESGADVTLNTNYFVAFNEGDVDVDIQAGALISVGGNLLLGQYDGRSNGDLQMDDNDITVTIAGLVDVAGTTILGDKYGVDSSGTPNSSTTSELVDVLLDITTGTLLTSNILFAPGGDLATYLATNTVPGNENTMGVRIGEGGQVVIVGSDATSGMNGLITQGLVFTDSSTGSIRVSYDGSDTLLRVVLDGDFNEDGTVDGNDFLLWQQDRSIGLLADWENNYGVTSLWASVATVPEPSSVLLLISTILVLTSRSVCN